MTYRHHNNTKNKDILEINNEIKWDGYYFDDK